MILRIFVLITLAILLSTLLFLQQPIPQDLTYHYLSDKRIIFSIPHFMDVSSSILFLIAGGIGLYRTFSVDQFCARIEKILWVLFFTASLLIGFGSMYYHLEPMNETLVWDRLPMTIAFMSLFCAILTEKINIRTGQILSPILLLCGILSVYYWHRSEIKGIGDLRPYFAVQYLSLSLLPLILIMFKGIYSHRRIMIIGLLLYIIAKLCEHFDHEIYAFTHHLIAGHTMKHIFSALSIYIASLYLELRHVRAVSSEKK